jgi:hypothetical protein
MRRPRCSIAGLLTTTLVLAVTIAALREATDLWDSGVFTLTLGLLLASVLLAAHRTGQGRAYWLGFATFGWGYLAAALIPPVESRLLTTKGLAYLDSKIPGRAVTFTVAIGSSYTVSGNAPVQAIAFSPDGRASAPTWNGRVRLWDARAGRLLSGTNGTSENFVRIGHSLLALAPALAGGRLSRWLSGRPGPPRARDVGVAGETGS